MGPRPVWTGEKSRPHRDFFVRYGFIQCSMVVYTRDIIGNKKSLSDVTLSVVCSLGHCVASWTPICLVPSVMWLSDIPIS